MEIVKRANVADVAELERSFKPLRVYEMDASGYECQLIGLDVQLRGHYRVMVVVSVDRNDANHTSKIATVVGNATGGALVLVPCDGAVEWAQISDIMEWRKADLARKDIEKLDRLTKRQAALPAQLADVADQMTRQKRGQSQFGPLGATQRVS